MSPIDFIILTSTVFGACLGSFAGMLVYRLCSDTPLFERSRSFCPSCDHQLYWYNNIPILSFLYQRGKCSFCKEKMSSHYLFIELTTTLLFGIIAFNYTGKGIDIYSMSAAMIFVYFMIICSFTDMYSGYIFDKVTFPAIGFGILYAATGHGDVTLFESIVGAASGYGSLWLVVYLYKLKTGIEGMGGGDLKILAAIGAFLGYQPLLYVIMLSSLSMIAVYALTSIIKRKRPEANTEFTFGQYLALGSLYFIFFDLNDIMSLMAYGS